MTDLSVVIPMFNAAATIERALRSVLAQTHPPAEVIVVDDGSVDRGADIVRSHFPSVTLIEQENRGPGAARNRGLTHAAHPMAAFLDADDVWLAEHLHELSLLASRFPAARLISTAHRQVGIGSEIPAVRTDTHPSRVQIDYFRVAARRIGVVFSSSAAADRVALLSVGGFSDDAAGEDLAAWARLALHHPVAVSNRVTALYIRRPDSAMARHAAQNARIPTAPADTSGAPFPLSPSMRVVVAALESGDYAVPQRSLTLYLDGRRTSGWRSALLRGDPAHARRVVSTLNHPWAWSAWPMRLVGFLPAWIGPAAARLRDRMRSVEDRISSRTRGSGR